MMVYGRDHGTRTPGIVVRRIRPGFAEPTGAAADGTRLRRLGRRSARLARRLRRTLRRPRRRSALAGGAAADVRPRRGRAAPASLLRRRRVTPPPRTDR